MIYCVARAKKIIAVQNPAGGGKVRLIEAHDYDPEHKRMRVRWHHCAEGQINDVPGESMELRLWEFSDLMHCAMLSGFGKIRVEGDYDGEDFAFILFEAHKS